MSALLCACALVAAVAPVAHAEAPTETPSGFDVVYADARFIDVAWDAPSDTTLKAQVSGRPEAEAEPWVQQLEAGQNDWEYPVTCGKTYVFTVVFRNAAGEAGPPSTLTQASDPCTPGPPPAPTGLHVTGITGGALGVAWDEPTANDIDVILLSVHTGLDVLANTDRLAYDEIDAVRDALSCGTTYWIALSFQDSSGQTSPVITTSATTTDCALIGPAPDGPANLHVAGKVGATSTVAWDLPAVEGVVRTEVLLQRPLGSETAGGLGDVTSATFGSIGTCGTYTVTVTWLFDDGRHSKPTSLALPLPACPAPKRTAPPPQGAPDPHPYQRPILVVTRQRRGINVDRNGRFLVPGTTVECPASKGACTVVVRILARIPGKHGRGSERALGEVQVALGLGQKIGVTGKLSPLGRKTLKRIRRMPVTILVEATNRNGVAGWPVHATLVASRR